MAKTIDFNLVTYRDAIDDDKTFIQNLTHEAMDDYILQAWARLDEQQACYQRLFKTNSHKQIIMYQQKAIGFLALEHFADRVFFDQIYLIAAAQRQGLGQHLINRVLADAAEKNIAVELIVLRTNPAKKLYERLGFKITKTDDYRYYMAWTKKT